MSYFGPPRWRYLALPLIVPSIVVFGLIGLLTVGMVRPLRIWLALMNWAHYESPTEGDST